jgi:type VI protein secretion system component VasK
MEFGEEALRHSFRELSETDEEQEALRWGTTFALDRRDHHIELARLPAPLKQWFQRLV